MSDVAHARVRLPSELTSARTARAFVAQSLARVDGLTADFLDSAALVATELVNNAVLHARGEITLDVHATGAVVRIEVQDDASQLPIRLDFDAMSSSGRGIALVAALASTWGVRRIEAGGKVVWCELVPDVTGEAND